MNKTDKPKLLGPQAALGVLKLVAKRHPELASLADKVAEALKEEIREEEKRMEEGK